MTTRRLAVDIVGYWRLIGADEPGNLATPPRARRSIGAG
jgi:hypothetical protein